MQDIHQVLDRYLDGTLDQQTLVAVLGQATRTSPEQRAALEQTIVDLRNKNRLSEDEFTRLIAPVRREADVAYHDAATEPQVGVGTVFRSRFILLEVIGRGGMGVVYRARDLRREEADDKQNEVAIKIIGQHLQNHPDAFITLQREARRAQQLAHPNIATVYDFDREGDIAYLCMELLKGKPLNTELREVGRHTKEAAFSIIRGIANGLAYAHERGIVHTDLKPGNIFLTDRNIIKILDFGLARIVRSPDQSNPETSFDAGRWNAMTPAYASIEMFEHQAPDPRDDIYALACVSYELFTGKHPFNRLSAPQAQEAGLTPRPVRGLTRKQNRALAKGLAFVREDRTASVREFYDTLTTTHSLGVTASLVSIGLLAIVATLGLSWLFISTNGVQSIPTIEQAAFPASTDAPTAREDEPTTSDERTNTSELTKHSTAQQQRIEPVPVDDETRAKIDRILEIAALHYSMGRIMEPRGSNATEAYLAVQEMQPGNVQAADGIERIVAGLVAQTKMLINDGNLVAARQTTSNGLFYLPDHVELLALQEQLSATR